MKDKASQKTEDEVLDQTFGGDQTFEGFDEEMTAQTQDSTKSESVPNKKKASGSNNTLLFVAGGVAAVGILGYMFVLKPMLSPAQVATPAVKTEVVAEVAPVVPLPPVIPASAPVTAPNLERQVASNYLLNGTVNPPVASPVAPPVTPPVTETVAVVVVPTNPTLPVIPDVAKVVEVSPSNAAPVAVIEELGRKFDTQGQQFRIALDDVGSKVTNLEKFRDSQLEVNKNVDDRLVKLEGGKKIVSPKAVSTSVSSELKVVKRSSNKKSKKIVEEIVHVDNKNILIDKSEPKDTKVKYSGVEYNIHSIYGGRIWLKNSDGSLSTYTSGDRLPSGELIKSVDDEKYSVNTDKRSFSKK